MPWTEINGRCYLQVCFDMTKVRSYIRLVTVSILIWLKDKSGQLLALVKLQLDPPSWSFRVWTELIRQSLHVHIDFCQSLFISTSKSNKYLGKRKQDYSTHRLYLTERIHADHCVWLVVIEQAQEVDSVLWWRILCHNKSFVFGVGLEKRNICMDIYIIHLYTVFLVNVS